MKKIAHLVAQMELGGMERLLAEHARHIDRSRFQLVFASLSDRGKMAEPLEALGWPVKTFDQPFGFSLRLVWKLARWLRQEKIDVLHTHNNRPLYHGALAAKLARVRVVHTRHGQLFQVSQRRLKGFVALSKLINAVVCVSSDAAQRSRELGVSPHKIHTILNGIDLEIFSPVGPNAQGPIVAVSRLSPEKDVANLIEAAAIATKQAADLQIVVAGDGACRSDLEQLIQERSLQNHVKLAGETRDVPGFLRQGRIFVLPSKTEGISLTLLEAMATGLPVIATQVGGTPEILANSSMGLMVPPSDPEALAKALLTLWDNAEQAQRLGQAGRKRVEAVFDSKKMVAAYENLY